MIANRFAYKIVKFDATGFLGGKVDLEEMSREFDRLGAEGWELVTVFDTNSGHGQSKWIIATFKRPQ